MQRIVRITTAKLTISFSTGVAYSMANDASTEIMIGRATLLVLIVEMILAKIIFRKKNVKKISPKPVRILVNNKSVKIVATVPVKSISNTEKFKYSHPLSCLLK